MQPPNPRSSLKQLGQVQAARLLQRLRSPFPWLTRQGHIYQLQNLLDETDLDPATRLEVREQLEALSKPDVSDDEQRERWTKVKQLAPGLWASGQRILVNVVSEAIKQPLGL